MEFILENHEENERRWLGKHAKRILAYLVLTIMYLGVVAFVPEINI